MTTQSQSCLWMMNNHNCTSNTCMSVSQLWIIKSCDRRETGRSMAVLDRVTTRISQMSLWFAVNVSNTSTIKYGNFVNRNWARPRCFRWGRVQENNLLLSHWIRSWIEPRVQFGQLVAKLQLNNNLKLPSQHLELSSSKPMRKLEKLLVFPQQLYQGTWSPFELAS